MEFWVQDKNGERYLVREPVPDDVEGLLNLINTLVDERAYITADSKFSIEQEREWLRGVLEKIASRELIYWVVEKDGKIVGGLEARRNPRGEKKQQHLVELAIALLPEARRRGLASILLPTLVEEAINTWGQVLIFLQAYASNEPAVKAYKKIGFVEVARLPCWNNHFGQYVDSIVLLWPESPVLKR